MSDEEEGHLSREEGLSQLSQILVQPGLPLLSALLTLFGIRTSFNSLDPLNGGSFSELLDEFAAMDPSEESRFDPGDDGDDDEDNDNDINGQNGINSGMGGGGSQQKDSSSSSSNSAVIMMSSSSDIRQHSKTLMNFGVTGIVGKGRLGLGRRWRKVVRMIANLIFQIFEERGHVARLMDLVVAKDHEEQVERRVRELEQEAELGINVVIEVEKQLLKDAEPSPGRSPKFSTRRRGSKDSLLSRPYNDLSPIERTELETHFQELLTEPKEDPQRDPVLKGILESIQRAMMQEKDRRHSLLAKEFTTKGAPRSPTILRRMSSSSGSLSRYSTRTLSLSHLSLNDEKSQQKAKRREALRRWLRHPTLARELAYIYALRMARGKLVSAFGPLAEECAGTTLSFEIDEAKMLPFEDRHENVRHLSLLVKGFLERIEETQFQEELLMETGVRGFSFPVRNLLVVALESPVEHNLLSEPPSRRTNRLFFLLRAILEKHSVGEFFPVWDPLFAMNEFLASHLPQKPSSFHFDGQALYASNSRRFGGSLDQGERVTPTRQTLCQLHMICFDNILEISNEMLKVVKAEYFEAYLDGGWPMGVISEGGVSAEDLTMEALKALTHTMRYCGEPFLMLDWDNQTILRPTPERSHLTGEDLQDLSMLLSRNIEIKDRETFLWTYKQCFLGSEAVDWLLVSGPEWGITSRQKAIETGQRILDLGLFRHISDSQKPFVDELKQFFTFVTESTVLNKKVAAWRRSIDPCSLSVLLLTSLIKLYTDEATRAAPGRESKALSKFLYNVSALESMSIAGLDHDKKVCFWLNIYHTLTLHAILVKGFPQGPLDRLNFHKSQLYQIGKHRYCLLDIEHAVLRNAMEQPETGIPFFSFPRFSDSDPRKDCALKRPENFLVFAIGGCTTSSPPIRVYEPDELRKTLRMAARDFLLWKLFIRNTEIVLPAPLQWYYSGFAGDVHELPKALIEYMAPTQKSAVKQVLDKGNYSVTFEEFDWSFSLNVQGS